MFSVNIQLHADNACLQKHDGSIIIQSEEKKKGPVRPDLSLTAIGETSVYMYMCACMYGVPVPVPILSMGFCLSSSVMSSWESAGGVSSPVGQLISSVKPTHKTHTDTRFNNIDQYSTE